MEPPVCGGRDDGRTRDPFCRCTPKEMAAPKEHISALLRAKNAFLGKGGGRQSDGHAPPDLASGFVKLANRQMGMRDAAAPAIRSVTSSGSSELPLHGGHAIGDVVWVSCMLGT